LIGGSPAAAPVADVTTANFMAEVVDASFEQPIIVDFWAPWWALQAIGPISKDRARGQWRGAHGQAQHRREPEIAQQMRIQSIPAVYAFKDGRPVDGFVGAQPESQVKQFVQRLGGAASGPSPIEQAMTMAKEAAQTGDHASAAALYSQILQNDKDNPDALAGLRAR